MKDDVISRQAAIDHWRAIIDATDESDRYNMGFVDGLEFCISDLSTMPSVQPERKHGHWIESHEHIYMSNGVKEWINWYCSECDAPNDKPTDFCPTCGADMRGEEDGKIS